MKNIKYLLIIEIIFLINLIFLVRAADTTYWLHNESDTQYTTYLKMNTSNPDIPMVTSEAVSLNNLGISCWQTNWTTLNFTYNATINGTWQFYINFSTSSSAGAVSYLFANIYKINQSGTRISIANSSQSTNIGGLSTNTGVNWTYVLGSGTNTNITVGQRVGVKFCVNVTTKKNQNSNLYWEQSTISKVVVPIRSSDTIPPAVNVTYPLNKTYSSNLTALNYTVSDNFGLASCFYSLDNGATNTSVVCGTNLSGLSSNQGSNTWNIYAFDTSNNFNYSSITFFLDSIPPLASYGIYTESNGSMINRNNIIVNVSVNDTNFANMTVYLFNSSKSLNRSNVSTSNPYLINYTSLADGVYYYNSTTYDVSGNLNSTPTMQVTIDTIKPDVNFTNPSDSGTITRKNILANISVNDTNFANMTVYLYNGSNYLLNTSFSSSTNLFLNYSNLAQGQYYVNVSSYDLAGNLNNSVSRSIYINRTSLIGNISATPNPIAGGSLITINASNISHSNNDSLQFFCSESTSNPTSGTTICTGGSTSSTYSYHLSCIYPTQYTTTNYTVYCRVFDGDYYSNTVNTTYNTSTNVPVTSILSVAGDTSPSYFDKVNDGRTDIIVSGDMNMTCKWSTSDFGYSNMSNTCASLAGGLQANCSINDVVSQGFFTRYVSCADIFGNGQNSSQNLDISFYLDYTAPTTSDNSVSTTQVPNYTITINEVDNVDSNPITYYCSSSSPGCSPATLIDNLGILTYTSSNRGANYLRYYSIDFAGNTQTIINKTININQLPVLTSASDNSVIIKGGTQVNVSITASDADNQTIKLYVCNSSGANYSGCLGANEYCHATGTANLSCVFSAENDSSLHTWYAYVFDSLNEASTTNPLTGSYTTDTTPPLISVISPENNTNYTQDSITAQISLGEIGGYAWYSLNSGANVSLSNSSASLWYVVLNNLNKTSYTIRFFTNDSLGNIGISDLINFRIVAVADTSPPAITILNPSNGSYNSASNFLINITTDEGLIWAGYKINEGNLTTLSNSSLTNWYATISLTDESIHNLTVFANDSSNNQANKTYISYTDSSAPRYSSVSATPNVANQSQNVNCSINWNDGFNIASVIIGENSLGSYENHTISLSGTSGSASYLIIGSKLANAGTYTCKFYATDIAGNTNSTSTTFTVSDVIPPVITVTSPSNATYNQLNLSISIIVSESASSAWYSLNGGANATLGNTSSSSWNSTLLNLVNLQAYSIIFYANDTSGNLGTSSPVSFTINTGLTDSVPPVISIDTIANGSYKTNDSVPLNITTNENTTWAGYELNSLSLTDMSNTSARNWNATLSALGNESTNILIVFANDTASPNNRGNTTITFYVDTTAPRFLNVSASPNSANESQNVTCNVYINDTFALSRVIIGENATIPGTLLNHTIDLFSEGYANYTIINVQKGGYGCFFYATDSAGNTNSTSTTFTVNDVTPPVISINSPLNQSYSNGNVLFSASSNENLYDLYYTLNNGVLNTSLSGSNKTWSDIISLSDGSYNVIFYGLDNSENLGRINISFRIDTSVNDITPPIITILNPIANTYSIASSNLLRILSNENLSSAGYVNGSGSYISLDNVTFTDWNKTVNFSEGQQNLIFYGNDSSSNRNSANKSLLFYVDLNNPSINSFLCTNPVNDSENINCSASVTDAVGLNYAIIGYNATGTWQNSSQIPLSGTSSSLNYIIAAANTTPGNFTAAIYLYDLSGRNNITTSYNVNVGDDSYPQIYNITYSPNATADLDPYVRIDVNATIVENYKIDKVELMWQNLSDGNWISVVMTNNSAIANGSSATVVYNASFIPGNGTYSFRINATDSAGNTNASSNITINVANESSFWNSTDISTIKSFTEVQRSENNSLGILYINNTGDTSLNLNISIISSISNRFNINYTNDDNASYTLSPGENISLTILVNTTGLTGLNPYNVSVISEAGTSIFEKNVYIQSVDAPYLVTTISKYSSSVTKGQTNVELIASVSNFGSADATGVYLIWSLPSLFTLTSGNLTRNLGNIPIGTSSTNTIIISVENSADDSVVNITATATAIGPLSSSDYKEVTVGSPQIVTVITPGTSSAGSGGGGGGGGAGEESIVYSKIIEIVRGEQDIFDVEVFNKYSNSILKDLTLTLEGFLPQYITISPSKIDKINSNEFGKFNVKLKIPSYKESYEEHTLKAVIRGKIVMGNTSKNYRETQNIKLIIQEVSKEKSNLSLLEAEKAILEMQKSGFNTQEVTKLLEQAKSKISENKYKDALDLSRQIIGISDKAFSVDSLINKILGALKDPKKTSLLTGNVAKVYQNRDNVSNNFIFTGKTIFNVNSVEEVLNMAIAAFKRGDFSMAEERAKSAQILLLLERKGNLALFLYLYWHFIFLGFLIFSFVGVLSYRAYKKSSVTRKIQNIDKEEDNIRNLILFSQKNYFSGKIPAGEYHRIMNQHQNKLAKIKQERLNLRNNRIKILKPRQITQDLGIERVQVENEIKKLQEQFYRDRKISENEYKTEFKILNERLAEIEEEKITLEITKQNKIGIMNSGNSKDREVLKPKKEFRKQGKIRILFFKIIGFIKSPLNYIHQIRKIDKKGVFFIDNKVIDILKKEASKMDCKGKWIKLNIKSKEEKEK